MDLATLIGLLGAFGVVSFAMLSGGPISMFINGPGLMIVMIGSLFVVLMKFNLVQFIGAIKVAVKAFSFKLVRPEDLM